MAFNFQQPGGSRRRRRAEALSEMNVIPLVDVVLVLLIMFMVTAHVMEFGLEVEVPRVTQVRDSTEELPIVTITPDGELYLNEAAVNINMLGGEVRRRFPDAKGVYVRADKSSVWDPIAQVFSALGEAKLDVRAVTQPMEDQRRGRK
jgi:biopolymer transport protein ExbD